MQQAKTPNTRIPAEERREQILEAALDEFAEKGFHGARTKAVARRAGISETLVFRHFPNKEALYRAALDHLFRGHPLQREMLGPMERNDDRALLTAMARHMLEHTRHDPRIIRLHLYQALEGVGGKHNVADSRADSLGMLAGYLRDRMDQGAIAPGDPRLLARLFHYMVFMGAVDRGLSLLGNAPELADEDLARQLVAVFLSGVQSTETGQAAPETRVADPDALLPGNK